MGETCPHCGAALVEVLTTDPPMCPACRGKLGLGVFDACARRVASALGGRVTSSVLYRAIFVDPGSELPPGARLMREALAAIMRPDALRWYANVATPEQREAWGPTPERTALAELPVDHAAEKN